MTPRCRRWMTSKVPRLFTVIGICLCLWYAGYQMYVAAAENAVEEMAAAGTKTILKAAGFIAVTEGEVVHARDGWTAVAYYYEWDGAVYKCIIDQINEAYPEHTKTPVIYCIGCGMGTCLVVGFYRKYVSVLGMAGLLMSIVGLALLIRKKRKE